MKYELTHDLLAAKVEEKASDEQKIRRKMRRFLNEQYEQYTQRQILLSKEDLEYIRPYLDLLRVSEEETALIRKSEAALKKQLYILRAIVTGIFIVISSLGLKAWFESKKYQAQFLNARARQILSQDPTASLRVSEEAYDLYEDPAIRKDMFDVYRSYAFYQTILHLNAPIKAAHMRPDGQQFLTVTQVQQEPHLWEMNGESVGPLTGHDHPVWDVAYSPDGKWMLSAGNDKTAILWDSLGNRVQQFRSENKSQDPDIRSGAVSENGTWILTGASSGQLKLWRKGEEEPVWVGELQREIQEVSMNATATQFAAATSDPGFHFFVRNPDSVRYYPISHPELKEAVKSIKFSVKDALLASGSEEGTVHVWSVEDSVVFKNEVGKHRASVEALAFSPDGNWLLSGGEDSTARLWHMSGRAGPVLIGHQGRINSVGFGPLSNQVMTASADSTLRLWNAPMRDPILEKVQHSRGVKALAFSQDARMLVSGGEDKYVSVFDIENDARFEDRPKHDASVIAVEVSADQNSIFSIDEYGGVINYNFSKKQVDTTFETHAAQVFDAAFSLDEKYLITGSQDSTARLWDLSSGKEILRLLHEGIVYSVAIDPQNNRLLTGCENGIVYSWDMKGNQIKEFTGHKGEVVELGFTAVSHRVLSGSRDQTVILWAPDGSKVQTYKDIERPIRTLAISPDESLLLVGYMGKQVTLFDIEGYPIAALDGHGDNVNAVSFSPKGNWMATGADDKMIRIWEVEKLPLSLFLKNNHLDPLSQKQRKRYDLE